MKEATPIQAKIQEIVTNGRGYNGVRGERIGVDKSNEGDLRMVIGDMDKKYPRKIFYEPGREDREAEESPKSRKRRSGLVPIGFTASRMGNGRTRFQSNDGSGYFIR